MKFFKLVDNDTEYVKPNEDFKLNLEKLMKKSYSVDTADSKPVSPHKTIVKENTKTSKETLNISSENIIENAKKMLKKSNSNRQTELMRSTDNIQHNTFQPFTKLKQTHSNKLENRSITNSHGSLNQKKSFVSSFESIKAPFSGSMEHLKTNRPTSKTSIKSANDVCKFLTCSSNSNSSSEYLDPKNEITTVKNLEAKLEIFEANLPIYDNFSLPENTSKKATPYSDTHVSRINKNETTKSNTTKKLSLMNQEPNEELQNFIKLKLKTPVQVNARSTQELNKVCEIGEPTDNLDNIKTDSSCGNFKQNKLSYSKSLKLNHNTHVNHIDKICDLKPRVIPSQPCTNKVILVTKNENTQDIKVNSSDNIIPLKKVSDLIKDLNGASNRASSAPAWKDVMLKKKEFLVS